MKHARILIIRGNSGSGKTALAMALQHELGRGTLIVSQDVIRRGMLWVKDGADTKAIPLLIDLVRYGKQNCDYVILEGILYADWYQNLFEVVKEEFKENVYAYYYELPFNETLARHTTKPNCHEFGEEDMSRWWREKDYAEVLAEKAITADMSLEDTVAMIIKDTDREIDVETGCEE